MSKINFGNSTSLDDQKLLGFFHDGSTGWATGTMTVRVRYSRGADYSGTCYYTDRRIYINLGRHLKYPFRLGTHLAKAITRGRRWYKPAYQLVLADGYQLAMFIFMHELYHLLVKRAGRNTRQKESMCDRFAARYLVDHFQTPVVGPDQRPVPRDAWDYQDLNGFVVAARDKRILLTRAACRPIPIGQCNPNFSAQGQLFPTS